ncbi:OmpA family protein [Candidatus Amoebophilus asiaticus]|nr:OmpA family protein [Candidatus Amoebophilus asiaticus]
MRSLKIKIILLFFAIFYFLQIYGQSHIKDLERVKKLITKGDKLIEKDNPEYLKALAVYGDAFKIDSTNAELNLRIGICYLHGINKTSAIPYLERISESNIEGVYEVYYLLGKANQLKFEFKKAIEHYQKFRNSLPSKELVKGFKASRSFAGLIRDKRYSGSSSVVKIDNVEKIINKRIIECQSGIELVKNPVNITIDNIGNDINSPYPEYAPIISADESVMYFTSKRPETTGGNISTLDGQYFEDIYVTYNNKGVWTKPENVRNINTDYHESAIGLSADGQTMFIYRDVAGDGGDIFQSTLQGDKWSEPKSMGKPICSLFAEESITLSGDGGTIYFVSNRPSGLGELDIYKCKKNRKGAWEKPINLGNGINTEYDEAGVFLHPNGKVLYFSSKGHNSMGGYDIFKSDLNEGKWSKPVNMGYPMNTTGDNIFIVLSASGERAYFASVKKEGLGETDIYLINMKEMKETSMKKDTVSPTDTIIALEPKNPLTLLKGSVIDAKTKVPLEAKITIMDNEKNEIFSELVSNSKTGKYLVTLPSGKNYGISVKKKGYLFHSENFDIPHSEDYQEIEKNIELNLLTVGSKVVLNNIFFDIDKATLKSASIAELQQVIKFLKENTKLRIEISGHTDDVGSDSYNQKLSEERALAVVQYLIKLGISKTRLIGKGYGETKPIATNKSEKGRQLNRRTEFEIVGN